MKTEIKHDIDGLIQTILHIAETENQAKLEMKELKKKMKNLLYKTHLILQNKLKEWEKETKIDHRLIFESAQENKIIYNQYQ